MLGFGWRPLEKDGVSRRVSKPASTSPERAIRHGMRKALSCSFVSPKPSMIPCRTCCGPASHSSSRRPWSWRSRPFFAARADLKLSDGPEHVVRHGNGPEREVQAGTGAVAVSRPKVRDHGAAESEGPHPVHPGDPAALGSTDAQPRRPAADAIPARRFDGRSPGDALGAAGQRRAEPVALGIGRLTAAWQGEHDRWQEWDPSAQRYVYVWAGGVDLLARMEHRAGCMLVPDRNHAGRPKGTGQVGIRVRETAQSWRELPVDVECRCLAMPLEIAVGDGALGFWKPLDEVLLAICHQRCRLHKAANLLTKVPEPVQGAVKADFREISAVPARAAAEAATTIIEKYGQKTPTRPSA